MDDTAGAEEVQQWGGDFGSDLASGSAAVINVSCSQGVQTEGQSMESVQVLPNLAASPCKQFECEVLVCRWGLLWAEHPHMWKRMESVASAASLKSITEVGEW